MSLFQWRHGWQSAAEAVAMRIEADCPDPAWHGDCAHRKFAALAREVGEHPPGPPTGVPVPSPQPPPVGCDYICCGINGGVCPRCGKDDSGELDAPAVSEHEPLSWDEVEARANAAALREREELGEP